MGEIEVFEDERIVDVDSGDAIAQGTKVIAERRRGGLAVACEGFGGEGDGVAAAPRKKRDGGERAASEERRRGGQGGRFAGCFGRGLEGRFRRHFRRHFDKCFDEPGDGGGGDAHVDGGDDREAKRLVSKVICGCGEGAGRALVLGGARDDDGGAGRSEPHAKELGHVGANHGEDALALRGAPIAALGFEQGEGGELGACVVDEQEGLGASETGAAARREDDRHDARRHGRTVAAIEGEERTLAPMLIT